MPSRISLVSGAARVPDRHLEVKQSDNVAEGLENVPDRHLEVGQPVDIAKGEENCATVQRSNSLLILGRLSTSKTSEAV
jgi:hypothetical protein